MTAPPTPRPSPLPPLLEFLPLVGRLIILQYDGLYCLVTLVPSQDGSREVVEARLSPSFDCVKPVTAFYQDLCARIERGERIWPLLEGISRLFGLPPVTVPVSSPAPGPSDLPPPDPEGKDPL